MSEPASYNTYNVWVNGQTVSAVRGKDADEAIMKAIKATKNECNTVNVTCARVR